MTTFEMLQNLTLYGLAHAVLIALITEGTKRIVLALTDKPLPKPIKVLIPVILGVTSLYVALAVVRALDLSQVVCANPEDCVAETLWVCGLWWGGVSCGAIGIYHITLLLWNDLILAAKNKLASLGKS